MIVNEIFKNIKLFNPIKSFYYSWKWCGYRNALALPVLISYGCSFHINKTAKVTVHPPFFFHKIRIIKSVITIERDAEILFKGKAALRNNTSIYVYPNGIISCGDDFSTNGNCVFNVGHKMFFGEHNMFSANALVYDTDLHSIYDESGKLLNPNSELYVGNWVWFGNRVTILKGTQIGDNIIFGASSVIAGKYLQNNAIYGGVPAKILKQGVSWSYEFPKENVK